MVSQRNRPKTWLRINDEKNVINHSISVLAFAKISESIQSAFDTIGRSKYGKDYRKEDCRLFMDNIEKGSIITHFYPQTYSNSRDDDEIDPYLTVTGTIDRLLTCYNTNPNQFKDLLEAEIEDPASRQTLLKNIQKISELTDNLEITTSITLPDSGNKFPPASDTRITELINFYKENGEQQISGIIVGIRGEQKDPVFNLRAKNGRIIKCHITLKDEEHIKSLYKHWVSVTGEVKITKNSYTIDNITEVKEQEFIVLNTIGNYQLKKPISFNASYDNAAQQWELINESLAIYGYGSTYQKTIQALEDEIECHVVSYTDYADEQHSPESLELKERLEDYIDIQKLAQQINEQYGEK